MEGLSFSRETLRELPLWYHREANTRIRSLNCAMASRCLRDDHLIQTVGEAMDIAEIDQNNEHQEVADCNCSDCEKLWEKYGCTSQSKCIARAKELIETLPQKWNPQEVQPDDFTSENERLTEGINNEWIIFQQGLVTGKSATDTFRIFTEGKLSNRLPPFQHQRHGPPTSEGQTRRVTIATEIYRPGTGEAKVRTVAVDHSQTGRIVTSKLKAHAEIATRTLGELTMIAKIATETPKEINLDIEGISPWTLAALTQKREDLEDSDFQGVRERDQMKITLNLLRGRQTKTRFLDPESTHRGREQEGRAKKKALEIMHDPDDQDTEWTVDTRLTLTGQKLSKLTQAKAYRAIRDMKAKKNEGRERTKRSIETTKTQIGEIFGTQPTEEKIWKSMRSKDILRKNRQFIWLAAHDAYMVGTQWLRESFTSDMKDRAYCNHCQGRIETLAHILTMCESPGQKEVWELAEGLWSRVESIPWYKPGIGTIIGAGLAKIVDEEAGILLKGDARLWKIIITESAYLIWRLRCERVIQKTGQAFTREEISNRWIKMMNERLQLDRRMTNKHFERKAINKSIVEQTWKRVIHGAKNLDKDWITNIGVLVGIETDRERRTGSRER